MISTQLLYCSKRTRALGPFFAIGYVRNYSWHPFSEVASARLEHETRGLTCEAPLGLFQKHVLDFKVDSALTNNNNNNNNVMVVLFFPHPKWPSLLGVTRQRVLLPCRSFAPLKLNACLFFFSRPAKKKAQRDSFWFPKIKHTSKKGSQLKQKARPISSTSRATGFHRGIS